MITDDQLIAAVEKHGSQRRAAVALGLNRRTVERRLARMADEAVRRKLLVIDLETGPNIVYTWGLWNQNIAINQIIEPGRVLCFAAKWHGDEKTVFYSEHKHGHEAMIRAAHRLMSEADAIVGWNSQRFDTRWLNAEFRKYRLNRPAGYKQVDLMRSQKSTSSCRATSWTMPRATLALAARCRREASNCGETASLATVPRGRSWRNTTAPTWSLQTRCSPTCCKAAGSRACRTCPSIPAMPARAAAATS